MLPVKAAVAGRRLGAVLAANRMSVYSAPRWRPLARPSFVQTRNIAVPRNPDNMGGPGGQEHLPESNALRRYLPIATCVAE
jgi:hypothetical protein